MRDRSSSVELLEALCRAEDLQRDEARGLFARVIDGEIGDIELTALLVALKAKGETPPEIAGAAEALRAGALPFDCSDLGEVVDTCGTGGDGRGTVNISTAVALLAAELGLRVAKHGNRSISSRCGSADVLEACGVAIDATPEESRRSLEQLNICFLLAPQYHAGVRHAMPVRRALATRTIFNMLGPLVNPARPEVQLMGVYDPALCVPVAHTLQLLGCRTALVVHGSGLDEIALHGSTTAARLSDGEVSALELEPASFGVEPRSIDELRGGDAVHNARWLRELLGGGGELAHRMAVSVNAGALLWITGRAADLRAGYQTALETLEGGKAAERLARWAAMSRRTEGADE